MDVGFRCLDRYIFLFILAIHKKSYFQCRWYLQQPENILFIISTSTDFNFVFLNLVYLYIFRKFMINNMKYFCGIKNESLVYFFSCFLGNWKFRLYGGKAFEQWIKESVIIPSIRGCTKNKLESSLRNL